MLHLKSDTLQEISLFIFNDLFPLITSQETLHLKSVEQYYTALKRPRVKFLFIFNEFHIRVSSSTFAAFIHQEKAIKTAFTAATVAQTNKSITRLVKTGRTKNLVSIDVFFFPKLLYIVL